MRGNGGGSVTLSNLLTKYIADKPFKIADSLYALHRTSEYSRYRSERFFTWLFMQFLTRKKKMASIISACLRKNSLSRKVKIILKASPTS
jgi:hypothetical protein